MAEGIPILNANNIAETLDTTDVINGRKTPRHIDKPSDNLFCPAAAFTVTTTPQALPTQACREAALLAEAANTGNIIIGNATAQSFPIAPGIPVVLPVKNVNLIWAKCASGTQTLYWLARD